MRVAATLHLRGGHLESICKQQIFEIKNTDASKKLENVLRQKGFQRPFQQQQAHISPNS